MSSIQLIILKLKTPITTIVSFHAQNSCTIVKCEGKEVACCRYVGKMTNMKHFVQCYYSSFLCFSHARLNHVHNSFKLNLEHKGQQCPSKIILFYHNSVLRVWFLWLLSGFYNYLIGTTYQLHCCNISFYFLWSLRARLHLTEPDMNVCSLCGCVCECLGCVWEHHRKSVN